MRSIEDSPKKNTVRRKKEYVFREARFTCLAPLACRNPFIVIFSLLKLSVLAQRVTCLSTISFYTEKVEVIYDEQ